MVTVNDEARWAAVLGREKAADGAFFYSVKTTGVYCRPSCGSRRARRENVAFYETREAAERAGFRPCLRCRPDQAPFAEQQSAMVARACRLIEESESAPALDNLAAAGLSRFHFHRLFRAITGVTPRAYAAAHRAQKVRQELGRSRTVTEAIYGAGYNSGSRFYEASPEILGMTPSEFRAGGKRAEIRFAVHAFRGAGRKLPVNLVFVAEGEEEIGSPHFPEIVRKADILSAFRRCTGVYMPMPMQSLDGGVTINLGAKGVVELELAASGEKWHRGPKQDLHSSNEARVDSPAWHLVQALATLVGPDGHTPAIDGFADKARPLTAEEKTLIREGSERQSEELAKKQMGVEHWVHDVDWRESLELLAGRPTVNIEGLVAGYTGPGGKTILPHRAAARLDLRLVPNMTAADAVAALRAHLAKRGFGDIEVNMTGGYDPTTTPQKSALIQAQAAVYRKNGIEPVFWPRLAGSWPGYVFTGEPLGLPAGHFGLGHGNGAHAPDEYLVIEATNPKVRGFDAAVRSQVEYLYELAG